MAKTYINGMNGKKITGQYGDFYNISINLEKLKEHANEKGYVNVTMSARKETGQYGETETFTLNDWKPESKEAPKSQEVSVEDLPF